ncbi:hypothetical protein JRQ81_004303 [Phrynocephalus forsythii]|uniref:Uncharacterized protein n=1 Tax=Phrynocephalus forsythii TaxID=171643 RepID=A0A9Q0XFP5_9SAUR|nr:hypothetical protein JRQ81_004303 [Phrynocephalus forsythii]
MPSSSRTLDDFAVPEEAQEVVTQHRPRIERLFRVELNILGVLESVQSPSGDPQVARKIWLQLQGHRDSLQRAKEYIKGLCAPELSEEVHYPKDMQCIFSGAHGLFLDCLTQGTSAHLTVLHPGALLISGLAEAFVMAQSRIQEFVEKHRKNPKLPEDHETQIKRAFRDLVEDYDDKHAMDLLILPTAVKEDLLNLVKEIHDEVGQQNQKNERWAPHSFGDNSSLEWEPVALRSGPEPLPRPQDTLGTHHGIRTSDSRVDVPVGLVRPPKSPQKPQVPVRPHGSAGLRDIRTNLPPQLIGLKTKVFFNLQELAFPKAWPSRNGRLGLRRTSC